MSTGNIPLNPAIPNQLITSALWDAEFTNIQTLTAPEGIEGYQDTDSETQIQTNPYPGSVLSKATSLAGEIERIRFVLAQMLGKQYWYQPAASGNTLGNIFITGEIRAFGSSAVPTGFLACDGASYLRTDYPDLFTAIGTTWGSADGTHFNVPDLRGKSILGSGTGAGLTVRSVGQTGGEETHVLITAELPSHSHGVTDPGHIHIDSGHTHSAPTVSGTAGAAGSPIGSNAFVNSSAGNTGSGTANIQPHTTGITTNNAGSDTAHNNMQPWACVGFIIKT